MKKAIIGTGLVLLLATGAFWAKQRYDDLASNITIYPSNVRVHGLVNGLWLRIVATINVVNNSATTIPITNINLDVLTKTSTGTFSSVAFIPQAISQVTLTSGQTSQTVVNIDINLLSLSGPLLALFKGDTLTLRLNSKLFVAGLFRVEIPVDMNVAIPAAIKALMPSKGTQNLEGISQPLMLNVY